LATLAAPQTRLLTATAVVALLTLGYLFDRFGPTQAGLFGIGLALGITLRHGAYSFAVAYRRLVTEGERTGITAHLLMLATAILLFAPVLAAGGAFGRPVVGAVAPVSVSMALGALVFGIGMQLANGCASGTLYTAGGGNLRMIVVLGFFCVGGFWGSLDLPWWRTLPGLAAVSLGDAFGWGPATLVQLAALAGLYAALRRAGGSRPQGRLWEVGGPSRQWLLRGPWPLPLTALVLAVLNWLTLLVAGHPWSITWALALIPAKVAAAFGWDPATSGFWSGGFPRAALARPLLADTVVVMNLGILAGAFAATAAAGKVAPSLRIPLPSLAAAAVGGVLMGYGARLADGCNIGALFSGIASASLHGWVWMAAAAAGTVVGVRLRPLFRLPA
jgi:hypothetical protein